MKRSAIIRKTPLRRKGWLRSVSKRHSKDLRLYKIARNGYLLCHPTCQVCQLRASNEIHHKMGRLGVFLSDPTYFLAVCVECHFKIENYRSWARKLGYSLDRLKKY